MNSAGPFIFHHPAMATTFEVRAFGPSEELAAKVVERVFAEIDRLENVLSYYRDGSELGEVNRAAHERDVPVGDDLAAVLGAARILHGATGGAFDPTVGPLMKCWRFHDGRGAMPDPEAVELARKAVGFGHVRLDLEGRTVRFDRPGVEIDLGAIGKGYAVDKAVAMLRGYRVPAALVHGGTSSAYALGAPPGEPGWRIRLRSPFDDTGGRDFGEVILRDRALSGSALGPEAFTLKGRRYGHEIDPRTGHPVQGRAGAWAAAPTATESDALSTAFFVLAPEETRAYCEANPAVAAAVLPEGASEVLRFGRWDA